MNTTPKYFSFIMMAILGCVFFSFLVFGLTTYTPSSLDYNIPIAQNIVSGEFLGKQDGLYNHSPGSSNAILSIFIILGIPLNLYGLLSWVILFIVCMKLAEVYGLSKTMSIIYAGAICTTISVVRSIGDQSIDKWLCTWFVLSMILLERPKQSLKYSLFLGFSLGMLVGTKYSGPLFFLALMPIYWKTIIHILNPLRFIIMGAAFTVFGLFWYIRNFIYEGNPYYPANLLFFKGAPNFTQQDWMLWKIPFDYPQNIIPLLNSFLSEYMIWTGSGFILLWYLFTRYKTKKTSEDKIKRLSWLSLTVGFVCLLLPITPAYEIELFHIISDMRYVYILMVLLVLAVFIIADKYRQNSVIGVLSILNAVPLYSFIPYQPKIFVSVMIIFVILYFYKTRILSVLHR